MNANTKKYKKLLETMLSEERVDVPGIEAERLLACVEFSTSGIIEGSSEKYIKNEKEWYESMDLCILGHGGIEKNPIWKNCATKDGFVNSNYGWCVYSNDNYEQFRHALYALLEDEFSRRAVIIYTRPNIHVEQCDGYHANQDMMCTCYTMFLIRDAVLEMHVHMRSNDAWFGLRYDLVWQQQVYNDMYDKLRTTYTHLRKGNIHWVADSLHIYSRDVDTINKWLADNN